MQLRATRQPGTSEATLRDYFAMAAMAALLAAPGTPHAKNINPDTFADDLATAAYNAADAMMRKRKVR